MGQFLDEPAPQQGKFLDEGVTTPPQSGIGQAYQNVRGAAGRLIDFLNDPTGSFVGARKAAGMPPASEQYNPMPANLTTGLAQTAVGMAPGGSGVRDALFRVLAGAGGGATGAKLEGQDPLAGAKQGAAPVALMEAVTPPLAKGMVSLPFVKSAINERQAQQLTGAMGDINPASTAPIQQAPVSPYLKGGTTAAQVKRATESGTLQDAVSGRFDQAIKDVSARAGNPLIKTPALDQAYSMMPKLAQDQLIGPVSPQGMTLEQAHAVRSWIGGPAFAQSPMGQGVGHIPQQRLWGQVTSDIQGALAPGGPQALADWQRANSEYGGMQALQEALSGAFQGQPNRIMLNRSALSDYLAKNEQDITRRLGGPQAYQQLVNRVLAGGQPGTRDYLTSGAGSPSDAFMQSMGRGTNTGSLNVLGVPFRTMLPNFGSQYTGQAPQALPPYLQNLLDITAQRHAGP
jgi:hypothetical protein